MTFRACRLGAALACALVGTAQAAPLPWTEEMIEDAGAREGATGTPTNQAPASTPGSHPIGKAAATDSLGAQMVESLTVPMTAADPADADRPPWLREFLATMPPENVRVDLGDGKVIEISPDETLAWAADLLAKGRRSEVAALAAAAIQSGADRSRAHALEAAVALADRRLADARDAFYRADEARPEPPVYRINGLVVSLAMGDASTSASAVAELARHAGRADRAGLAARMALLDAARARGDKTSTAHWAEEILRHPTAGRQTKLDALDNLLSAGAEDALATAIDDLLVATEHNAPETFGLLRWLNAHRREERTLAWTKGAGKTSATSVPFAFAVAEALARLARWEELDAWLDVADWKDMEPLRDFLRAMLDGRGTTVGGEAWDRSIAESKRALGGLQVLLDLAEDWGWHTAVDALLWEIASIQRNPRPTLRHLFARHRSQRDAQGMRRVMRRVHELDPDDWIASNNLAHLELLLRGDIALAGRLATDNFQKRPEIPAIATTYAFYLWRSGQTAKVLPVIQAIAMPAPTSPEARLYQAILLAAAGNRQAATDIASGLKGNDFLPEDWALWLEASHPQ